MKQKIYQADAFTDKVFEGTPAAVCPLESWINDELMQKIAIENNLAETAFYVKQADRYVVRWFTPSVINFSLPTNCITFDQNYILCGGYRTNCH